MQPQNDIVIQPQNHYQEEFKEEFKEEDRQNDKSKGELSQARKKDSMIEVSVMNFLAQKLDPRNPQSMKNSFVAGKSDIMMPDDSYGPDVIRGDEIYDPDKGAEGGDEIMRDMLPGGIQLPAGIQLPDELKEQMAQLPEDIRRGLLAWGAFIGQEKLEEMTSAHLAMIATVKESHALEKIFQQNHKSQRIVRKHLEEVEVASRNFFGNELKEECKLKFPLIFLSESEMN
jgi:hypothetical protein